MPLTRSKTNNLITTVTKENILGATGLKRKADGRSILGDVTKSNLNSNTLLPSKKPGLVQRRNNLKQAFQKADLQKKPEKKTYTGHDNLTITPLEKWRVSLREELESQNKFYDQEKENLHNHIESPEFSFGIFEYMKWREEQFEVPAYLTAGVVPEEAEFDRAAKRQTGFAESDRKTLVDWMVEFQEIQECTHETLYLAVRLCDYYFSRAHVSRDKLQLFAFVGFLLASKFEERWPPTFEDMIYLSEDTYKKDDFVQAEIAMLKVMNFDINLPISYRYLRRYGKCIGMDMKALTVSRYYLELTLQEYEYVNESQYKMASACLWLALHVINFDVENRKPGNDKSLKSSNSFTEKRWTDLLTYYTGCHEWDIVRLARRIADTVRVAQQECEEALAYEEENASENEDSSPFSKVCKIIYKKYQSDTFFCVSEKELPSDEQIATHERRTQSEKVDYEADQEPAVKRRSSGCTSRLRKMTLRGSTTPTGPTLH